MGLPKKKRGFRAIQVDSQYFNWRFSGVVEIRPAMQKNNKLMFDFGWYDDWIYVSNRDNKPPAYYPRVIIPAFVATIIEFALKNGWETGRKINMFRVKYHNGKFEVAL